MYSLGMLIIVTNYLIPSSKKAKPPGLYQVSLFEREDGVRQWPLLDQNLAKCLGSWEFLGDQGFASM